MTKTTHITAAPRTIKAIMYCEICERMDHNARALSGGKSECPARVIRIKRECGSLVPGSDPGTR